ncbi:MAG: glycosyltransferase family 9 protein [Abditibacteriales bacterium]|nr:glycosyltransferase family 9 protein [Abditibacteriales bacterium]
MNRILIVKLSSLGDIVHALPTVNALRDRFPQAHIAWLVDAAWREILDGVAAVDEVLINPLPSGKTFRWRRDIGRIGAYWRGVKAMRRELRARQFDAALDLQGLFRSAIWCRWSGAPVRVGLRDNVHEFNYVFLTHRVPSAGRHAVERMLGVAQYFGADISQPRFGYEPPPAAQQFADEFLHRHHADRERLIGINAGASRPTNRWDTDKFAAVADALAQNLRGQVILFGAPSDVPRTNDIARQMKTTPIIAAGQTTISQLAALLQRCTLLVSGDTGPMHLATAVGTPVVALFGPAAAWLTGPYGKSHVVVEKDLPCRPCFHRPRACQGRIDCLKMIDVAEVVVAARAIVNKVI